MLPCIIGILNITKDSFSDGGLYLDHNEAIRKGLELVNDGASIIDVGAESSHPDSKVITPQLEIERLSKVIKSLKKEKITISVDTYKPEVMKHTLGLGANMINDITAMSNLDSINIIKEFDVPVVIMYSKNLTTHSEKAIWKSKDPMKEIINFFEIRINKLVDKGIKDENIILDPGMGFFIGSNPEPSLIVLRDLRQLKKLGKKILISTSRKSFIGTVLNRNVSERASGTLATEIWSAQQGVDYIRTHDVKALYDALKMLEAIQNVCTGKAIN
ncbi:MAG: dihydropteroate synthase [Spirochaetota bacterium]|nr:dihydropteroate synthase [Spirochaetota bacterium]